MWDASQWFWSWRSSRRISRSTVKVNVIVQIQGPQVKKTFLMGIVLSHWDASMYFTRKWSRDVMEEYIIVLYYGPFFYYWPLLSSFTSVLWRLINTSYIVFSFGPLLWFFIDYGPLLLLTWSKGDNVLGSVCQSVRRSPLSRLNSKEQRRVIISPRCLSVCRLHRVIAWIIRAFSWNYSSQEVNMSRTHIIKLPINLTRSSPFKLNLLLKISF